MALGRRKREQQEMWVATRQLPRSPGHPFYRALNKLLAEAGFDAWVEALCEPHYARGIGRPGIPPGVYFRMLLAGYFEGIGSQRGIAWRCSDSRSLQEFLGVAATDETPDHSSLSRVAQRLPVEAHREVFQFVLRIAVEKKLLGGKTVVVDSTTLEANAAMKSIVRRDTGEDWNDYLRRLMQEQGLLADGEVPTVEDLRRFDKKRKDKKVSNEEWVSETDPDSRITKMKDGTTHLAYKAEHVLDEATDLLLAAEIYPADRADTETLADSVMEAQVNVQAAGDETTIREAVADKGYHAAKMIELCDALHVRTYIPEPSRKHRRRWTDKPPEFQRCVDANRRRVTGERGRRLSRRRSELAERSFAHVCETGGARRCWLHGLAKVTKRYLIQAAARNLGLILRSLLGVGTARSLQGLRGLAALTQLVVGFLQRLLAACLASFAPTSPRTAG